MFLWDLSFIIKKKKKHILPVLLVAVYTQVPFETCF